MSAKDPNAGSACVYECLSACVIFQALPNTFSSKDPYALSLLRSCFLGCHATAAEETSTHSVTP